MSPATLASCPLPRNLARNPALVRTWTTRNAARITFRSFNVVLAKLHQWMSASAPMVTGVAVSATGTSPGSRKGRCMRLLCDFCAILQRQTEPAMATGRGGWILADAWVLLALLDAGVLLMLGWVGC